MKRVSFLSLAFVILSSIVTLAQDISTSIAPPPSGMGNVGMPMEFTSSIEALGGDYNNFQWTLSFPTNVLTTPNSPTGGGLTWTQINTNTWQANITKLMSGESISISIMVMPTAVTTAGAEVAISQISGYFDNDADQNTDNAQAQFFIESSLNVITISSNKPNPVSGEQVTLTATGCPAGGVYQNWSPAGGIVTGTGNNMNTIVAPTGSQIYTVDCSLGGQGTITVTGTAAPMDNISATASPATINSGGSSTLTASGCVNPSYNWTWAGGSSAGATISVTPASTTIYTATCANATGGTSSTMVTVTVNTVQCLANAGTLN